MAEIKVAVINASTVLPDSEVAAAVPALQMQVSRDFAAAWGIDVTLTFVPHGSAAPKSWWLIILDNSDADGALGHHVVTNEGFPLVKVFVGTDQHWTTTASRQLLEMLKAKGMEPA